MLPWAALGGALGAASGATLATGAALRAALGAVLGFVGNLTLLGRKGGSASYAGSVGRSAIIFLLFGRGSSGGLGVFGAREPASAPVALASDLRGIRRDPKQHEGQRRAPQSFEVCQPEAQVSQGDGAPNGHEVPVIGALQRYLGQDVVPQIAQRAAGVGQLGAAEVDLAVCHHADELKDLLSARDEAGAKRVVDAEGLGRRCGRRGGVVHNVRELLLQLQIVQNEAVAVAGYAEAVRGLAIGSRSEVGADPGCQPGARVGAFRKERPIQRAECGDK